MIVDDSKASINLLQSLLKEIQSISLIATATSADEALPLIVKHEPDLLFLDVEMPSKTGFDLIEDLRRINTIPIIVFITAYEKYAINAIRCAAFDFLLKPVDPNELKHVLSLAMARQHQLAKEDKAERLIKHMKRHNRIKLPNRNGFTLINTEDIFYIEADWSYSTIYLSNGKNETISMNIGALEKLLPEGQFFRISRAIIIQLSCLQSLNRSKKLCSIRFAGIVKEFPITGSRVRMLDDLDF